ncbi:YheV family putative zinc ribbon protein [Brenneria rubrifaciens]|uniref:YheV family putative metal-binding protein n=1 Tax=Brenneria rubrifaciens TaxID=55213 RepID=A0A4P8QNZ7_9GAMM|nr:YheV family putative zinc ribbon protein [Brenneria rubrifaciens]QCR07179.1 YheV family putative metal-binding protein [Brenneria rubrifaciens]
MRKRFIAGAVCPKCQAQDTLAIGREGETDIVTCVKCGYHQSQSDMPPAVPERPAQDIIGIFHPD